LLFGLFLTLRKKITWETSSFLTWNEHRVCEQEFLRLLCVLAEVLSDMGMPVASTPDLFRGSYLKADLDNFVFG
jgi:hypothetical protein